MLYGSLRATGAVDRRSGRLPFRLHEGDRERAALRIGDRAADVTERALGHRVTAECDDDGENRCDSNVYEVRGHRTSPHEYRAEAAALIEKDSPHWRLTQLPCAKDSRLERPLAHGWRTPPRSDYAKNSNGKFSSSHPRFPAATVRCSFFVLHSTVGRRFSALRVGELAL